MKSNSDSLTPSAYIDSKQAKDRLRNTLAAYESLHVPDIADVMDQFKEKSIFIYGAGCYGQATFQTFSKYGISVKKFLDIKAQSGDTLFGIPVHRADDELLDARDKEKAIVVTALVKDHSTREGIFDFIRGCGFKTIVDAQSIRCHSVYFDNKLAADKISDHIKKQSADILRCFDLFKDEHSRNIYYANTMAHILRKYDNCLESTESIQYFPDDIFFDKGYGRFIDCGGYIGDTVDQLLAIKEKVRAIAVFEPNMGNFSKLSLNMNNYSSRIPELYLWPCAVSNKTDIRFMDYDGGSSALNSDNHGYEPQSKLWKQIRSKLRGIIPSAARDCSTYQFRYASLSELEFHNKKNCVQCVSLDDVLKNFAPTFLKMDVEGEERKTIIGAENIIKRHRPDLAICVYHCINHLWDIALLIDSWNLNYEFHLKTHNSYTMETVLYATSRNTGE